MTYWIYQDGEWKQVTYEEYCIHIGCKVKLSEEQKDDRQRCGHPV